MNDTNQPDPNTPESEPGSGPGPAPDLPSGASTPDALLAAGRALFARRGYDGTSIRAITQAAQANLGAVTYHFGSKRALYEAVLESVLAPLAGNVQEAAGREGLPLEQIQGVMEAMFHHLDRNPDMPRLMLQELTAGKPPPPVVVRTLQKVAGTLAMLVGEGQSDLSVRPGDPLLMALSVVSQPVYFSLIREGAREVIGLDQGDPATRRRVVDHAINFARKGLAGDPEAFHAMEP